MSGARLSIVLAVAALAVACGEQPQTAGADADAKKVDTPSWQGTEGRYAAPGWKEGERASWEDQLRARTRTQNEYIKISN